MTLHDTIESVLREFSRPMKPSELADYIFTHDLYVRNDSNPVDSKQIISRVRKYPEKFSISSKGFIELLDLSIKPYIILSNSIQPIINKSHYKISRTFFPFLIFAIYKSHEIIFSSSISSKAALIKLFEIASNSLPPTSGSNYFYHFSSFDWLTENFAIEIGRKIKSSFRYKTPKPTAVEFGSFFNEIVNEYSWDTKRGQWESSTPNKLIQLITGLANKWEATTLFDPFAGRASMLVDIINKRSYEKIQIIAGDINNDNRFIGELNLFLNGSTNYIYSIADAFTHWNSALNADIIISSPPFGKLQSTNLSSPIWYKLESTDLINHAIQLCIYHLKFGGKAILVIPSSFLYSEKNENKLLRKYLIDEGFFKGSIQLPRGIFKPFAAISTSLIILSKEKQNKDKKDIFLFDPSFEQEEFGEGIFNEIINAYQRNLSKGKHHCWVSSEEMIKANYECRFFYYSIPVIHTVHLNDQYYDSGQFVELNRIVNDTIKGIQVPSDFRSNNSGFPLIEVSNLSYDQEIKILERNDITKYINNESFVKKHENIILKETAVLVSTIGKSLKPTLFKGNFEALCSSEVFALICEKDKIFPEYLIIQFFEKYFIDQLNKIKKGTVIPRISVQDFYKIKILIIPLDEQQQYIAAYYKKKVTATFIDDGIKKDEDLYNLLSRIIHSLRTPTSTLNMDMNDLESFISLNAEKRKAVSLNDFIIEPLEEQSDEEKNRSKLSCVLPRINRCISDIRETLGKAESTLKVGRLDFIKESFYLKSFFELDIHPLYQHSNCIIEIKGPDLLVEADKYQIKELFKNFIDNAIKHGFDNHKSPANNKIIINIQRSLEEPNFILIEIQNNGKDFPEGFNLSIFEKQGTSTDLIKGFGFGGYLIKKIIENHRGFLRIDRSITPLFKEFKVRFKIFLPIQV